MPISQWSAAWATNGIAVERWLFTVIQPGAAEAMGEEPYDA